MAIDFGLAKPVGGNDYLAPLQALALGRQAKTEEMKAVREQRMLVSRDQALQQYAQGDKIGARQTATASGDFDLLNHLQSSEDAHRKALGDAYSRIGQAALSLKSVPPAQRPQAFAQMAPALQQLGVPQEVLGSVDFSDASLDGYVAQAQSVGDQIKRFDERNKPVTLSENAKLVTPGGETLATNEGPDKIISLGNGQFVVQGREGSTIGGSPGVGGGGSLGERNGNPGNIRDGSFAKAQPGYIGPGEGGFARFEPGAGEKAQERLLSTRYLSRGFNTVDKIIERYAPASENSAASRANYKSYVASKLGLSIGDTITLDKLPQLAQAMREFETGNTRGGGTAGPRVMGTPTKGPNGNPPSGFRWTEGGDLEAIPGGPEDPNYAGKPLTQQQRSLYTQKRNAIQAVRNQIARVEAAKNGYGGYLGGLIPGGMDAESDKFDKAATALAPLIRQITRVPGEGAMSDYESRLSELTLPSRRDTKEGRAETLASMRALLDNLDAGYGEILGGGGARSVPQSASASPNIIRYDRNGQRIK